MFKKSANTDGERLWTSLIMSVMSQCLLVSVQSALSALFQDLGISDFLYLAG